jgi:hypothetical protein
MGQNAMGNPEIDRTHADQGQAFRYPGYIHDQRTLVPLLRRSATCIRDCLTLLDSAHPPTEPTEETLYSPSSQSYFCV